MTAKPVCSVCIANYNGIDIIAACIDSVLAQKIDGIEIIVHDDASTDGSADFIATHYPQVNLIRSTLNVGYCISNNRMVAAARGGYLLLLNNDAALRPGAIQALFDAAVDAGDEVILSIPQYDMTSADLIDRGCIFDPFMNPVPNKDENRHEVGMVIGACLWISKTLWHDLGGFPEWYGSIAEDMYLCCAARHIGKHVKIVQTSGYDHMVGQSFGGGKVLRNRLQTTYRRRALSERNKIYTMILFYPPVLLATLVPMHFLLLALEGLVLAAVKRNQRIWRDIYWSCFSSVLSNRSTLIAKRKQLSAQRRLDTKVFCRQFTWSFYKLTMVLKYGVPTLR